MIAAITLLLAQNCATLLPPANASIEWFRNGRPFAVDEWVRGDDRERVYRRVPAAGTAQTRVLSCGTVDGRPALEERIGNGAPLVLPLGLRVGSSTRVQNSTVRRIERPEDASAGSLWYAVTRAGPELVGVRPRIGLEEVRRQSATGDAEILRAVIRPLPAVDDDSVAQITTRLRAAELRVRQLESIEPYLRDSLAALQREVARLRADSSTLRADQRLRQLDDDRVRAWPGLAVQLIADSAQRLPSDAAARAAAWSWPGAGHRELGGGTGWIIAGALPVLAAAAVLVAPDTVFTRHDLGPTETRRRVLLDGVVTYALMLLLSYNSLDGQLNDLSAQGATRESFLRNATVVAGEDGRLRISIRQPVR